MKSVHTLSLPRWGKVAHRKKNSRILEYIGGVTDEVVNKKVCEFYPHTNFLHKSHICLACYNIDVFNDDLDLHTERKFAITVVQSKRPFVKFIVAIKR